MILRLYIILHPAFWATVPDAECLDTVNDRVLQEVNRHGFRKAWF